MANRITVKMDTRKAVSKIRNLGNRVNGEVRKAIAIAGIDTERMAKRFVPVDTGRLRSSIRVLRFSPDGLSLEVGTEVEYASKIEFGIGGLSAQPYLFPAAEIARVNLIKRLSVIV